MKMLRAILFLLGTFSYPAKCSPPFQEMETLLNSKNIFTNITFASVKNARRINTATDDQSIMSRLASILDDQKTLKQLYQNYQGEYSVLKSSNVNRHQIFRNEMLKIAQHNIEARSGFHSWEMGVNFFTEMNNVERARYSGCLEEPVLATSNDQKYKSRDLGQILGQGWNLFWEWFWPKREFEVDWNARGKISPVKDQGDCYSCWAFSTTAAIEALIAIDTNKIVDLSEQQLVECAHEYGCKQGASIDTGYVYIIRNGLELEKDYPYKPSQVVECQRNKLSPLRIRDFYSVTGDEVELRYELKEHPVSVGLCAKTFSRYSSGVFNECTNPCKRDHAVLVVGFGSQGGKDFWLIKNSYGQNWGEKGYIRIQRNKNNMCGVAGVGIAPVGLHVLDDDV